jgi:hypothetical protein
MEIMILLALNFCLDSVATFVAALATAAASYAIVETIEPLAGLTAHLDPSRLLTEAAVASVGSTYF